MAITNWFLTKGGKTWTTGDEDEIYDAQEALDFDTFKCPGCVDGFRPKHGTTLITKNMCYTYQCASGSRWYNPATSMMEGRSHCTCDYCF